MCLHYGSLGRHLPDGHHRSGRGRSKSCKVLKSSLNLYIEAHTGLFIIKLFLSGRDYSWSCWNLIITTQQLNQDISCVMQLSFIQIISSSDRSSWRHHVPIEVSTTGSHSVLWCSVTSFTLDHYYSITIGTGIATITIFTSFTLFSFYMTFLFL